MHKTMNGIEYQHSFSPSSHSNPHGRLLSTSKLRKCTVQFRGCSRGVVQQDGADYRLRLTSFLLGHVLDRKSAHKHREDEGASICRGFRFEWEERGKQGGCNSNRQ